VRMRLKESVLFPDPRPLTCMYLSFIQSYRQFRDRQNGRLLEHLMNIIRSICLFVCISTLSYNRILIKCILHWRMFLVCTAQKLVNNPRGKKRIVGSRDCPYRHRIVCIVRIAAVSPIHTIRWRYGQSRDPTTRFFPLEITSM
jgi:hypothetical protein